MLKFFILHTLGYIIFMSIFLVFINWDFSILNIQNWTGFGRLVFFVGYLFSWSLFSGLTCELIHTLASKD